MHISTETKDNRTVDLEFAHVGASVHFRRFPELWRSEDIYEACFPDLGSLGSGNGCVDVNLALAGLLTSCRTVELFNLPGYWCGIS